MMESVRQRLKKLNKTALIIAIVHFFVSFFTDQLIFEYVLFDFSSLKMALRTVETWCVKLVFLLLVICLWQVIFQVGQKYRAGGFSCRQMFFAKIVAAYMCLMMILLILTWPGIWRMDEFGILSSSVQLFPHFWQNYITSVFYILALMLIPFPAGVIIVQNACASLVIARVVTLAIYGYNDCNDDTKNTGKAKRTSIIGVFILCIPFLMFPVLDSNLYPIRMSLYAYLELWLVAELYFRVYKANQDKSTRVVYSDEKKYFLFLACLAAAVTVWRTEAIYYIVMYPLILLLIGKGRKYIKQILLYIIIVVILFVPQKAGEKLTSGSQYELTSVVLPLVPLVVNAVNDNPSAGDNKAILNAIDAVVNVDVIIDGAARGKSGINLFWGADNFQREYNSKQFAEFKTAYYQLILKYPDVFLRERWQTFTESSDLLENTTELFVKEDVPNYNVFQTYPLSKPISNEMRTSVIKLMELRTQEEYTNKLSVTDYVYSAIPAILVLAVISVWLLVRRRWTEFVLILTVLGKVPLIFLTAPSRLFMYYYSVYIIGYCVLFYAIYKWFVKRKDTSGGNDE